MREINDEIMIMDSKFMTEKAIIQICFVFYKCKITKNQIIVENRHKA